MPELVETQPVLTKSNPIWKVKPVVINLLESDDDDSDDEDSSAAPGLSKATTDVTSNSAATIKSNYNSPKICESKTPVPAKENAIGNSDETPGLISNKKVHIPIDTSEEMETDFWDKTDMEIDINYNNYSNVYGMNNNSRARIEERMDTNEQPLFTAFTLQPFLCQVYQFTHDYTEPMEIEEYTKPAYTPITDTRRVKHVKRKRKAYHLYETPQKRRKF